MARTLATSAPFGVVEPERLGDVGGDRLEAAPSQGRCTRAAFERRLHHEPHHVGRNRKSNAVRAAAAREDRGVDADEPAVHVDQGAAGIAGIDGRVGLDEELIVGDADLGAGQRRDDAAGHRLADAERIADGEHQIAHLEAVGVAELDGREWLLFAASMRSTARSVRSSLSTTLAGNSRRSDERDGDLGSPLPWMTWLLVTMTPSDRR